MPLGDASTPADDPLIGRVVAERYRVLRKVGQGGMGAVYQAQHALIEKNVALKVLAPELSRRSDVVARFLQEAKNASRIGHENVVDISDFGQSPEGVVYIAMEYLDGQDLARLLAGEGRLPWMRARPILMQVTKALRAAHEHGILHRGIKPENVFLVQREGRPDFVKVLDFGFATVAVPEGPRLSQSSAGFMTPEYISPEEGQGLAPDHRIDVYAVGCLMYRMLTGEVPFRADSYTGILTKHMAEPPIPPRRRRPGAGIADDVEAVCMRALEKDRENRWQDMDAFYRALGAAGGEPFEPSGAYIPHPSLRFPVLAKAEPTSRGLKTDVAPPRPSAAVPDQGRPLLRTSAGAKLGVVIAGAIVAAALVVLALRPSHKVAAPAAAAAAKGAGTSGAASPP